MSRARADDLQAAWDGWDGASDVAVPLALAAAIPDLLAENAALRAVEQAARELHERVEMDESVGVCLSDRVPSLRLGAALADPRLAGKEEA